MNLNRISYCITLIVAFLLVSTLGCSKKEGADKSNSQVVAKVNGDEISIHQLNLQLSRLGPLNEEQSKLASREVLKNLVNQQLLKQKAIESKLDRDPRILQILEQAKDQILAQAYLDQEMAKAGKPTAAEVDKFYTDHPELFENRRVFKLQELVINAEKDKQEEIEKNIQDKKDIKEVAEWLKSQDLKFTVNANVRAAEQLPGALLQKLQPLQDGDVAIAKSEHSLNVLFIAGSQTQPIAKDKATPVIEQYFINQNKTALGKKQITELLKKAKIEYLGQFSDIKPGEPVKSGASQAKVEEAPKADPATKSGEAPKTDTQAKPTDDAQSHLDKGLSGL